MTAPADPTAAQLARIAEEVAGRARELYDSIDRELFEPIRETVTAAADAHQALLEEAGLAGPMEAEHEPAEAPPAADGSLSQGDESLFLRLVAYRVGTRARVLEPVAACLSRHDPGRALTVRIERFRTDLARITEGVPSVVERGEPGSLYQRASTDGPWTRVRKAAVRAQRKSRRAAWVLARLPQRLIGRVIPSPPVQLQSVPLSALAEYHANVRVPVALSPLHDRVFLQLGRAVQGVERSAARWTKSLLALETRLDRPSFHRPTVLLPLFEGDEASGADTPEGATDVRGVGKSDKDDLVAALADDARNLSEALEALARVEIEAGLLEEVDEQLAFAASTLARDVTCAGSFMLRMSNRVVAPADRGTPFRLRCERWKTWHDQAAARVRLTERLCWLRGELQRLQTALGDSTGELVSEFLSGCTGTAGILRSLGERADHSFAAVAKTGNPSRASALVRELIHEADRALVEGLLTPLGERRLARLALAHGVDAVDGLVELPTRAPETLKIHGIPEDAAAEPDVRAAERELRLREICRSSIDALLVEGLRRSVDPVSRFLEGAEAAVSEIPTIIHYNLDAALEELETFEGDSEGDPLEHPRELTVSGLARAADQLEAAGQGAASAVDQFLAAGFDTYHRGWSRVQERALVEARVHEELMDLRSRVLGALGSLADRVETRYQATVRTLERTLYRGSRRARKLVELGQTAVGASQVNQREGEKTLEELAGLETLIASLPLVYRRLFSFQPVSDRSLVEGREADLSWIRQRYERWQPSVGSPLIITGAAGSGMTSFLKVIPEVLEDPDAVSLELRERVRDETEAARLIGAALGYGEGAASASLASLAERVLGEPVPERPRLVTVDRLEHAFLRTPGASDLVGQLLAFMVRTAPRILWIGAMVDQAWQLVEKTEGRASGLPRRHQLDPIDRSELQSLILGRHRRSGLPLVFDEGSDSPLLRRRLRRAPDEEERQVVLREHFFDRLHRLSDQNIRLALYYWLRSAVFQADRGVVRIQPLQPLSFGFLEQLEMPEAFALKALLQHGTLTLEEHDRIFRTSREDSFEIFSTLRKFLLIEPENGVGARNDGDPAIDGRRRYRIRPLLTGPVEQFLRGKNIVH